jgi:hypothetical protein
VNHDWFTTCPEVTWIKDEGGRTSTMTQHQSVDRTPVTSLISAHTRTHTHIHTDLCSADFNKVALKLDLEEGKGNGAPRGKGNKGGPK